MLEEKKAAEKIIKQFYDAALEKDTKISSGDGNEEKMLRFEREEIHKKVIDEYLQPLINRWNLTNCVDWN